MKSSDGDVAMIGLAKPDETNSQKFICEGCGCAIYAAPELFKKAQRQLTLMGKRGVPCCYKCAEPLFDEVAAGNGTVAGPLDSMLSNALPEIDKARERHMRRSN